MRGWTEARGTIDEPEPGKILLLWIVSQYEEWAETAIVLEDEKLQCVASVYKLSSGRHPYWDAMGLSFVKYYTTINGPTRRT